MPLFVGRRHPPQCGTLLEGENPFRKKSKGAQRSFVPASPVWIGSSYAALTAVCGWKNSNGTGFHICMERFAAECPGLQCTAHFSGIGEKNKAGTRDGGALVCGRLGISHARIIRRSVTVSADQKAALRCCGENSASRCLFAKRNASVSFSRI